MIYKIFSILAILVIVGVKTHGQEVTVDSTNELLSIFLQKDQLPNIHMVGTYEYSDNESEKTTRFDFDEYIEFGTGKVLIFMNNYVRPVLNSEKGFSTTNLSIVFDGDKWMHIDYLSEKKSGIESITTISEKRSAGLLEQMYILSFPLFAPLNQIQAGNDYYPFLDVLTGKHNDILDVKFKTIDSELIIMVKSSCLTDIFTFDSKKNYLLTRRQTDYNGCDVNDNGSKLLGELRVTDSRQNDKGFWYPARAVYKMHKGKELLVKRVYTIDSFTTGITKDIVALIPSDSLVSDERLKIQFNTSSGKNSLQ